MPKIIKIDENLFGAFSLGIIMEFVLMSVGDIGLSRSSLHESKMVKVESITRTHNSHHSLFLSPILEKGHSIPRYDGSESFREDSINLLLGNSELAKELKER